MIGVGYINNLSKTVTDAVLVLRGLEELYPEITFIMRLRDSMEQYPDINWGDAMSRGQITSKQWLLHELQMLKLTNLKRVVICGGWVGILARLILDNPAINSSYIILMDTDVEAIRASYVLNQGYEADQFMGWGIDCCHKEVGYQTFDTIINTSCEHFQEFDKWWEKIPTGKFIILQSNNVTDPEDHVNCVTCAEELVDNVGMSTVLFSGSLPCIGYKRFMVIGVK